ncbi:MAG: CtsR family transcriptional regulator [Clostridia bacterium]|nr:CtsR family transcriptional regulator [Clostridia bacterium]
MLISDEIAKMIEQMLGEADGQLELQRNELASKVGCVPSQINYVITSRFTPERGYIIESRRGGGGYIRITKVQVQRDRYLMHLFASIGEKTDEKTSAEYLKTLFDNDLMTSREYDIARALIGKIDSDEKRADGMRQIILAMMK